MRSFEINKHGKIVFPANCFPDLDFSTFESLEQLDAVIRRDFDSKAPTGTDILERIKTGAYQSKFELMRDMALNLFWANRYKMTMYDVRPTRWADVPRSRDDIYIPIQTPWEDRETKVTAVQSAYPGLAAQWDAEVEDSIFEILFDVFGHRKNHATKLSAVVPTVADLLSDPGNQTLRLNRYDPDFRRVQLRRDHRLQRGRGRAGGAAPLVDGPAQPVPVGSRQGRPGPCRRVARRRLRGGVPSA